MSKETLYDILEIDKNANSEEIKKAYRKKALISHPDKGGDPEIFKKINEAYTTLSDDRKRKEYDLTFGINGINLSNMTNMANMTNMTNINIFNQAPINLFKNVFEKMFNTQAPVNKSPIVTITLPVSLEELSKRTVKNISISRDTVCACISKAVCDICNGTGQIKINRQSLFGIMEQIEKCACIYGYNSKNFCENCNRTGIITEFKNFELHLTPSMKNGHKYFFKDDGNQTPGFERGDLTFILNHKNHEKFTNKDGTLICKQKLSLKESLCGYDFQILHPSGESITVKSDNITKFNDSVSIKNKGMTYDQDLIVSFEIVYPERFTKEQKEIFLNTL